MTKEEIKNKVLWILGGIAPEAASEDLRPEVSFRDQLDLDSMDFLNFVIALDKEFQIEVPEPDYPALMTLTGCVDYLVAALARQNQTV